MEQELHIAAANQQLRKRWAASHKRPGQAA